MKSKKIGIYLALDPSFGGLAQYAKGLLTGLKLLQHDDYEIVGCYTVKEWQPVLEGMGVDAIDMSDKSIGVFLANVSMMLRLPLSLNKWLSRYFNPIVRKFDELDFDLLIFPTQDSLTYLVNSKVIGTIHDLMHIYESQFPEVSQFGRRKIRDYRFSNIANHSTVVLVDSNVGKEHVKECYNADENKIMPLPYFAPVHSFLSSEKEVVKKKYNLPDRFIFYPAQYWAHKNHSGLIKAAHLLISRGLDIKLLFTGKKIGEYEKLKELVLKLNMTNNVIFMEQHIPDEDLGGVYKNARAMMMPTYFGPTNIPPLEGLANGCPVAVSGIYGMPEQLGDAALFFDQEDISDMAAVMERLWNDDRLCEELVTKGYEHHKAWGLKQFSEALADIILSIEK